jgi:DDE superfamily endonuclease
VQLLVDGLSPKINLPAPSFSSALRLLSRLLTTRLRELGTQWRRLPADRQALLVLAHLQCGHTYVQLAAGFGVGTNPVTRYVAEAVDVQPLSRPTSPWLCGPRQARRS